MHGRYGQPARDASPVEPTSFLAGGGEMGALMRAKDWSRTPLGPVEGWPQSLKTAVRIMLDLALRHVDGLGPGARPSSTTTPTGRRWA